MLTFLQKTKRNKSLHSIYILLGRGRKTREAKRPSIKDAVMPAALAVRPPVRIPVMPSVSTASRTPFAMVAPKPRRGTDTPAPKTE